MLTPLRYPFVPILILLIALAGTTLSDARPNLVFILSDNQSYYELSRHGHAQVKTPHLDRLAAESVEFTRFYAPPFCSPSRAVILTGRYAMRSGVHNTIGGRSILHRSETTLADRLAGAGYRTGIFGKWHLGFSFPHRPEDRGFEEVFVHGGGGIGQMEDYFGNTHFDPTFIHNGKAIPSQGFSTDVLFDRAIEFIDRHRGGDPFFCFVSTPVTHSPHRGPKVLVDELRAAGVTGNLELFAQVQNLDTNVGRLLEALDSWNLRKNTIVMFASDQGMNDRGAPHGDNRKGLAYDPAHHVPFFISVPGTEPRVCERLAGMLDVCPTLLDLCGIPIPEDSDGLSLVSLIRNTEGSYPVDRTLIVQCPRGRVATKWQHASVKTDRWRLVEGEKLYDIHADPRQDTDVAAEHPEIVEQLRQCYEAYWADLPDQAQTLSRHPLGSPECKEIVLNGMDWYTGASPWNAGHLNRRGKGKQNGAWAVTVVDKGTYVFELRHYPREADKPLEWTGAKIQVGETVTEQAVDPAAKFARFQFDLEPGDYDLQTWLSDDDQSGGALFVYVSKLDQ